MENCEGTVIIYLGLLVFLVFHDAETARSMLNYMFPEVGSPLPEINYAADCRIITPEHPSNPIANVWNAVYDIHMLAHLIGWWGKMIILRDWKLCVFLSVVFE